MTGRAPSPLFHLVLSAATLASFALCRLVYNAFGLRLFGADAVGRANSALAWSVLLALVAVGGVAPALSRFLPRLSDQDHDRRRSLAGAALRTSILSIVPVSLALALASMTGLAGAPTPGLALLAIVWSALFATYTSVRTGWFAVNSPGSVGKMELWCVAAFLFGLGVAWVRPDLYWLPLTTYFLPAIPPALRFLTGTRSLSLPPGFLTFGAVALLGSLGSMGVAYVSTVVVAHRLGFAEAGVWATLMSLSGPLLLMPRTLTTVFLPKLSNLEAFARARTGGLSRVHQGLSSAAIGFVATVALLLSPYYLPLVVTSAAPSTTRVWALLLTGVFGVVRAEPLVTSLAALGRQLRSSLAVLLGGALCLLVWATTGGGRTLFIAAGYALFGVLTLALVAAASRSAGGERLRLRLSDGLFLLVVILAFRSPLPPLLVAGLLILSLVIFVFGIMGPLLALAGYRSVFHDGTTVAPTEAPASKVCLAASAGGHLSQLLRLRPAFLGLDLFFVTTSDVVAADLRQYGNVYVVGEGNRNHPLRIAGMAARCALAIARERPDFVISTGAAAGCLACAFGKLSGARILWLDSIANTERLSLSARIVRRFADVCLTQWPNVAAKYGVEHAGAVL